MTKTFGEMSRDEKIALFAAWVDGGPIEFYSEFHGKWFTRTHKKLLWDDHSKYRIATTKPSIDWSHVAEGFDWLACDSDGKAYLYRRRPARDINNDFWATDDKDVSRADRFASFNPGDCDWKDSLTCRPRKETE